MSTSRTSSPQTSRTTSSARSQRWQPAAWKRVTPRGLRIEATRDGRLGDAAHTDAVRRDAQAHAALLVRVPGLAEGARDDVVQPLVHLFFLPEVLLEALHPLEVGDDDAAGVREHVGQDAHAAVLEDLVCLGRDGAVGALADDARLHLRRVLTRDHLLQRAGREQVAVDDEELLIRDRIAAAEALERPGLGLVRERGADVEPPR